MGDCRSPKPLSPSPAAIGRRSISRAITGISRRLPARSAEAAQGSDDLVAQADALAAVLAEGYGYAGDTLTYEDLQNANLMRVIDRKKGLPVALGILYIHAGRAQGWDIAGLAFPGHFLVRIEGRGERRILDPFAWRPGARAGRAAGAAARPRRARGRSSSPRITPPSATATCCCACRTT